MKEQNKLGKSSETENLSSKSKSITKPNEEELQFENKSTLLHEQDYQLDSLTPYVMKKFVKRMKYTEVFIGHQPMSFQRKLEAILQLTKFNIQDQIFADIQKARNELEALISYSKEFFYDENNLVYSTSQEIEEFLNKLEKDENWINEYKNSESLNVYLDKFHEINSTISALMYRKIEHHLRSELIQPTQDFLMNITHEISAFAQQFPWIGDKKIRKINEIAVNATIWFEETLKQQETIPLSQDPVLKSDEIRERIFSIGYLLEKLSKMPIPKDWHKKEDEKSNSNHYSSQTSSSENSKATRKESTNKSSISDYQKQSSKHLEEYVKEDL